MSQDKNSSDYESNSNSSTQLEHIMISYSHKQKEIAFNLTKHLKEKGYKVWFDQDNMRYAVNTFRSLAEAVEKSYAVCIIYSENYKNSEYAEMEATYAVFLKKPIICLRAQRDYKPKGWLGLITARENRIDISGKYPFDESLQLIINSSRFNFDVIFENTEECYAPGNKQPPNLTDNV
ncbi:unnamed protein product [Schistosoma rodhaini]|nr:unnamed protein product [Schistosoma rodhaini]